MSETSSTPRAVAVLATQTDAAVTQLAVRAQTAADAQAALAKAATVTVRALKNLITGFDELHLATQDTQKTSGGSGGRTASSSSGGGRRTGSSGGGRTQANAAPAQDETQAALPALPAWLEQLQQNLQPAQAAWQAAFAQMQAAASTAFARMGADAQSLWQASFVPLGNYLLQTFVPGVVNGFSTAVAPILADVADTALHVFANGFETACGIAQNAVDTLVRPALEGLGTMFGDVCGSLQAAWAAYGPLLLEGVSSAMDGIGSVLETVYGTVVQPVLANLIAGADSLWSAHLKPLWDNLLALLGSAGEAVLNLWNGGIQPFLGWMADTFGPILATALNGAGTVFGGLLSTVADVASGVLGALRGVTEFVSGIFTADWQRAWDGVSSIFSGIWDAITSLVEGAVGTIGSCVSGLVGLVTSAVQGIVLALGSIHFELPSWLTGGTRGLSLPVPDTALRAALPALARGTQLPAAAFAQPLQTPQPQNVAEALRQVLREQEGPAQQLVAEQPVQLSLDGDVFYRAMLRVRARRGAAIAGGYADVF